VVGHLAFEWWIQLWPNVFAVSFWTVPILLWHHWSIKRHVTREHDKTRAESGGSGRPSA
jgi:hypothetical protein